MATYKVHKTKDYTVMSNTHLRDKNLSLKAKGLLSVMLSLPDEWDYSVNGLVAICRENNTAVESALKELKEFRYLVIVKKLPNETESGRLEYEYNIYEKPCEKQGIEKQGVENQGLEFQGVENNLQLNTNKSITNKSITDKENKDNIGKSQKRFEAPTLEEVTAYCRERKNSVNPQRFIDYYTANGWKVGKNKMKDWKAAVRTWEQNSFSNGNQAKTYGRNGIAIDTSKEDDLAGIL